MHTSCDCSEISQSIVVYNKESRFQEMKREVDRDLEEILHCYRQQILALDKISPQVKTILPFLVQLAMRRSALKPCESLRPASDQGEQCNRCGMFCPSHFTGSRICSTSNWCEACTQLPSYICDDTLRQALNFRKNYLLKTSKEHSKSSMRA